MHPSDFTGDAMWDAHRLEALISNVPGAIYRCSPESDWAMQFLADILPGRVERPHLLETTAWGAPVRSNTSSAGPAHRNPVSERNTR